MNTANATFGQAPRSIMAPHERPANAPIAGMILVGAYVVAICFERIIDIEVVKPYRVIGILMVLFALAHGLKWGDRFFVYAAALVTVGVVPTAVALAGPEGNLFYFLSYGGIFILNILTYVAIISILKSERDVWIAMALHAAAMLIAMAEILMESRASLLLGAAMVGRIQGDFKNPAFVCSSLVAAYCFIFILARQFATKLGFSPLFSRVVLGLLLIIMLYATTHTGSRSGVAGFVVGSVVFVMYLFWRGKNKGVSMLVGAALIVGVLGGAQFVENIVDKESNILAVRIMHKQLENDTRIGIWQSGLRAGLDSWGLGVGIGQYPAIHRRYYAEYADRDAEIMVRDMSLHSEYLTMFTEYGVLGLVIYFLILAEALRLAYSLKNEMYKAYAYAIISMWLVMAIGTGALVHFSFWVYIAFIVVLHRAQSVSMLPAPRLARYPRRNAR